VPKLLYGGVTEEILMRWGLMSALIWLPWRFLQRRNGPPRTAYVVGGVVVAALLFGLGHLPAVVAMGAELNPTVVAHILVGNTLPGILFGVLYWRWGLEAAILAHALAHAASTLALSLV
jgi:membrane protease YdiL (CAAX protease family)